MKILVTGATGFVGSAIAIQLLEAGHEVRVLVRKTSDQSNLATLPIKPVTGDLVDRRSLEQAMSGCEALFHVAADYRIWAPRPQVLYDHNVTGTRNIMRAALDAGIGRIVYTSSVAVLGNTGDGTPASENTPVTLNDMIGHYKRSKFLAEREVRELIEKEGLPAVIVNPSTPIGPRDIKPTPTGRMIEQAARGKIPAFVDTGLNIVHVDDVAAGHLLAFDRGEIGERYILGGEDMSLRDILAVIAGLTGRRAPTIELKREMVYPVAWVAQAWARLTGGREPLTTVDGLRMSSKRMFFSSDKARETLGYAPRPAANALADAVEWFMRSRDTGSEHDRRA